MRSTTAMIDVDAAASIFDVTYKLEPGDLLIDNDFESGPIVNVSSLGDLSAMVRACQ